VDECKPLGAGTSPLFHFGMTGAMSVRGVQGVTYKEFSVDTSEWPPKFHKLVITFDNGVVRPGSSPPQEATRLSTKETKVQTTFRWRGGQRRLLERGGQ
jgi:hypothetical protein